MGIAFVEGFDWAGSVAGLDEKWQVSNSGTGLSLTTGRDGVGQALRWSGAAIFTALHRPTPRALIDQKAQFFSMGFAFRISAYPLSDITTILDLFGGTGFPSVGQLSISPAGALGYGKSQEVGDRANISALGSISLDTWHHVMIRVEIEDTAASGREMELWLDGQKTTYPTARAFKTVDADPVDSFRIGPFSGQMTGTFDLDDLWILDEHDGVAPTTVEAVGDRIVATVYPDGDGNTSAWTRSSGLNDWEMVDEGAGVDHDVNATYVSSQTAGQQSLFTLGAIPAAVDSVVSALAVNYVSSKEGALGGPGFHAVKRTNTTTVVDDGFVMQSGQDDYVTAQKIWITDGEGVAWTESTINSSEFGMEVED